MCPKQVNDPDTFMEKVKILENGCWEWQGTIMCTGYGEVKRGGKKILAHRHSFRLFKGPLGDDEQVRHECDYRPCVNPDHLLPGTDDDNKKDALDRDRFRKGEGRPEAKLTIEQVRWIRKNFIPRDRVYGARAIGRKFGVSHQTVSDIAQAKTWERSF
jgi:hypothetical protein